MFVYHFCFFVCLRNDVIFFVSVCATYHNKTLVFLFPLELQRKKKVCEHTDTVVSSMKTLQLFFVGKMFTFFHSIHFCLRNTNVWLHIHTHHLYMHMVALPSLSNDDLIFSSSKKLFLSLLNICMIILQFSAHRSLFYRQI